MGRLQRAARLHSAHVTCCIMSRGLRRNGDVTWLSRNSRGPRPRPARDGDTGGVCSSSEEAWLWQMRPHVDERRRGTSSADVEGQGRVVAPRLHADDGLGPARRRQRWLPASASRRGAPRSGLNGGRRVGRLRRHGLGCSEVRRWWGRWPASVALSGDLHMGRGRME
jgi:hypothetical protein